VNRDGSQGDGTGSDGASVAAPQPSEGDNRAFLRTVFGSLRVGVETDGIGRPNPMVGFLRGYAEEEVNIRNHQTGLP